MRKYGRLLGRFLIGTVPNSEIRIFLYLLKLYKKIHEQLITTFPYKTSYTQNFQALSAQCEGGPVPLVLETGEVIPPANLTHVPSCSYFTTRPLPPARTPHLIKSKSNSGPFIFTPIHFGSLERKSKKDEGKMGEN